MGQEITVTARPGASPTVRMFDCNRSLTGMAIERYAAPDDTERWATARRAGAPAVRARRDQGHRVLERRDRRGPAERWAALEPKVIETIEHLFGYYGDDAGWSDESLRAIGVEPLPRPEPTE